MLAVLLAVAPVRCTGGFFGDAGGLSHDRVNVIPFASRELLTLSPPLPSSLVVRENCSPFEQNDQITLDLLSDN